MNKYGSNVLIMMNVAANTNNVKKTKFKYFLIPLSLMIFVSFMKFIDSFRSPVSFSLILASEQYERNTANRIMNISNVATTDNVS